MHAGDNRRTVARSFSRFERSRIHRLPGFYKSYLNLNAGFYGELAEASTKLADSV